MEQLSQHGVGTFAEAVGILNYSLKCSLCIFVNILATSSFGNVFGSVYSRKLFL